MTGVVTIEDTKSTPFQDFFHDLCEVINFKIFEKMSAVDQQSSNDVAIDNIEGKSHAKLSAAPRIEGSGDKTRYEFSCADDILQCLDEGTLVFKVVITHSKAKIGKDGKKVKPKAPMFTLKGIYSDRTPGKIYFALKESQVNEIYDNGKKLVYPLKAVAEGAANFQSMMFKYDTDYVWHGILQHLEPYLENLARKYYSSFSANLHCSNDIKFAKRPNHKSTVFVPNKETKVIEKKVMETEWDFSDVRNQSGRILLGLGNPWLFPNENFGNVLMGCACNLAGWKYLTDAEKNLLKEQRDQDKKRKMAEKGDKPKKIRKVTTNPIIEDDEDDEDDEGIMGADAEDVDVETSAHEDLP